GNPTRAEDVPAALPMACGVPDGGSASKAAPVTVPGTCSMAADKALGSALRVMVASARVCTAAVTAAAPAANRQRDAIRRKRGVLMVSPSVVGIAVARCVGRGMDSRPVHERPGRLPGPVTENLAMMKIM